MSNFTFYNMRAKKSRIEYKLKHVLKVEFNWGLGQWFKEGDYVWKS